MERGGLSSTIPSSIGRLSKLYFLDLDFNSLSGAIPAEISQLVDLEQLDLNNNLLEGQNKQQKFFVLKSRIKITHRPRTSQTRDQYISRRYPETERDMHTHTAAFFLY